MAPSKASSGGGFQSMGFTRSLLQSVLRRGYKIPTPIQRKCIPLLMNGKDVVGMARTGSGKTAAFVLPMIHKLGVHSAKVGARGLILAPTRELAMQTGKAVKELSRYTDLRCVVLVGGDAMEDQFGLMASNPDIIVATPGRLLHLLVEMGSHLNTVEVVVFDEADRLFEMGFAVQLHEILHRLPSSRQTCLFSATLPNDLIEFAKAGLSNPTLIRLDSEMKISKDLEMAFFSLKQKDKSAALLFLLRDVIGLEPNVKYGVQHQTIIFVSTRHHVEHLSLLLSRYGYATSFVYGQLDQMARKMQVDAFRSGETQLLVVTDVAARGIDIPILENVINYDFCPSPKVFLHRVGRVARAGRSGRAFSFIAHDDLAYLLDLKLFLGLPLVLAGDVDHVESVDYTQTLQLGALPIELLETDAEWIQNRMREDGEIASTWGVCENAWKKYAKTKPSAAAESFRLAKELVLKPAFEGTHPMVRKLLDQSAMDRNSILAAVSRFRPSETVFEIGKRGDGKAAESALIVRKRREALAEKISKRRKLLQEVAEASTAASTSLTTVDTVGLVATGKFRDESAFIPSTRTDRPHDEEGYAVNEASSFLDQAKTAALDLKPDDASHPSSTLSKTPLRWDPKKKKFIRHEPGADNKKFIRSESGAKIPVTFKSGTFKKWQEKTQINLPKPGEQELANASSFRPSKFRHNRVMELKPLDPLHKGYESKLNKLKKKGKDLKTMKSELKNAEQIRRERMLKEKRRAKTGRHAVGKKRRERK